MIGKLITFFKERKALKELQEHPIYGAVITYLKSELNDKSKGLGKNLSEEGKASIVPSILSDIQQALTQSDPVQAARMRIINLISETAKFQVLVIPPPPELDATGLRAYEGISGELRSNISKLAKINKHLEEFLCDLEGTPTAPADMQDAVVVRYLFLRSFLHAYNIVRIGLGDCHKEMQKDWFIPCYISLCIWQESLYRKELGIPPAIHGDKPDWKALMHSTWMNRVEEGHNELLLEWEKSWVDVFNEPSPYVSISASIGSMGSE